MILGIFDIRYFQFWGLDKKYGRLNFSFWSRERKHQVSSIQLKTVGDDIF